MGPGKSGQLRRDSDVSPSALSERHIWDARPHTSAPYPLVFERDHEPDRSSSSPEDATLSVFCSFRDGREVTFWVQ